MSEMEKLNNDNLENVTGGNDEWGGGWTYGTVHGVVHYDSSSCLTLRDSPNGGVRYTDAGTPMGWQNGESILIQPASLWGGWIMAQWNGHLGWTDANYVYY